MVSPKQRENTMVFLGKHGVSNQKSSTLYKKPFENCNYVFFLRLVVQYAAISCVNQVARSASSLGIIGAMPTKPHCSVRAKA